MSKEDYDSHQGVAKWLPICIIYWLAFVSGPVFGYTLSGVLQTEPRKVSKAGSMERREQNTQPRKLFEVGHDPTSNKRSDVPNEAGLEDRMDKIQFYKGRQTSYKRSWPIPQLQCKGGCDSYEPAMVQCTSVELPDQDSKWRCEADLPRHLKFQKTTINCEGFESEEDDKVLSGSCGLEYSLTNSGLKPIPGRIHRHYYTVGPRLNQEERMKGWTASWLVVVGVIIYLINHNWRAFKTPAEENEGLRAQVVRARRAWKRGTAPCSS